jgi:hypothetical protein
MPLHIKKATITLTLTASIIGMMLIVLFGFVQAELDNNDLKKDEPPGQFAGQSGTASAPQQVTPVPASTNMPASPVEKQDTATADQPHSAADAPVQPSGTPPADEMPGPLDQVGTLWSPYLEWSLTNLEYSGNPFDLKAEAAFVHTSSGETRRTGMFYAGNDTWKFRFTATQTGEWTFRTSSPDPELDNHTGKVMVHENPDPKIKGFLVSVGNKFARQIGENGELEAVLFNVWQGGHVPNGVNQWYDDPDYRQKIDQVIEEYILKHGMAAMYSGAIANRWFDINSHAWDEHDSQNPDLRTFEGLERGITYLHSKGVHLHIWMWGDETRRQTPVGVGGINGEPDLRLQRYIAARLGPLPGWSMGYGFDLGDHDWIAGDIEKLGVWVKNMNEQMGWPHLLFTRGFIPDGISGISYSSNGPGSPTGAIQTSPNGPASYEEVVMHMDSDLSRPHLYEERFIYLREFEGGPPWTMDRTRKVLWWNVMAGGMGAFWGFWDGPLYPNPEQMQTYARFWERRFLLDMERVNHLSDGVVLLSPSVQSLVVYKEDTDSIVVDLSWYGRKMYTVAVDTKLEYQELQLGELDPGVFTWKAPYTSDWALAFGFED